METFKNWIDNADKSQVFALGLLMGSVMTGVIVILLM